MSKFIFVFYMITLTFAHWAWGDCASINEELRDMKAAQSQITLNLLENYKTAADQVAYTAIKMNSDSSKQRLFVREQAIRSSTAHAKRLAKSEAIVAGLSKATDVLIKKIAICIKEK